MVSGAAAFVSSTATPLCTHGVDRSRIHRDAFYGHAHTDRGATVYRMFVRRNVRAAFGALSRSEFDSLLAVMSSDVHHTFPTHGALGGERHARDDVATWFARLGRLLPGLRFDVTSLAVDGWPWNTVVGVEWTNTGTLLDGSPYANSGAHVIRMRNGKIVSFHAYFHDVAAIDDALARVAATGVEEATAPPIVTGSLRG